MAVFAEGIILVGVSERTNEKAIDLLSKKLRGHDFFKKLVMVRLPESRSQMHLDTIFYENKSG